MLSPTTVARTGLSIALTLTGLAACGTSDAGPTGGAPMPDVALDSAQLRSGDGSLAEMLASDDDFTTL